MPPATPAKCSFGTRAERVRSSLNTTASRPRTPTDPALASLFVSRFKHVPAGLVGVPVVTQEVAPDQRLPQRRKQRRQALQAVGDGALRQLQAMRAQQPIVVGDGDTCRAAPAPRSRPPKSPSECRDGAAVTTRGCAGAPATADRWRLITRRWARTSISSGCRPRGTRHTWDSSARSAPARGVPPAPAALSGRAGHAHSTRVAGPVGAAPAPPRRRSWRAGRASRSCCCAAPAVPAAAAATP